jgi:hypothetical protein
MPVVHINKTPPLPEGEYAGVLTKVSSGYTQKTNDLRFTFEIRMKDGRILRDALYFREKVAFRIEQIAKSAELTLPEGYEETGFIITTDDLEGRVVYFGVKHNSVDGRTFINVNYHTLAFAVQQNPGLAGMYPLQAPRHLRAASPEDRPPETGEKTISPPPAAPVTSEAATGPEITETAEDTLTPEEFAQAVEAARALKRKKVDGAS